MEREIHNKFYAWKISSRRKPLIIRGARQVGKTYSVLEFGKQHYRKVHQINFEKTPKWKDIFEMDLDAVRIVEELEFLLNDKIDIETDLLFFDEIQNCPKAIMSLRYFYEQLPKIHLIAAGSLLEFALNNISFPVGRVQTLEMLPMSFSEFIKAFGKEKVYKIIQSHPAKLSSIIHETILEDVFSYFFVGGMPEAVKHYCESGKMADVFEIHSDLLYTYAQDFSKYSPSVNRDCLNMVLSASGKSTGKQIKYSQLASGFSNPTIKSAFMALANARLLRKVRATSPSGLPLEAGANEKRFKSVFLDIGLMAHINGLSNNYLDIKHNMNKIFDGAMAEQFVGQEFLAAGQKNLYYWARQSKSSTAEVDYLLVNDNEIIPIEVKNSSSGRLKSLHLLLNQFPNIKKAYVLSHTEYGKIENQKLEFIPIYYASHLAKKEQWVYDKQLYTDAV
ncbi:MAG: ATP-binding protein [Chlorobi bacterium]|nr:ATP-binding protein [Chlorobiota bacterium]